jgi:hypothetical protein
VLAPLCALGDLLRSLSHSNIRVYARQAPAALNPNETLSPPSLSLFLSLFSLLSSLLSSPCSLLSPLSCQKRGQEKVPVPERERGRGREGGREGRGESERKGGREGERKRGRVSEREGERKRCSK